jgi:hypothetical protein
MDVSLGGYSQPASDPRKTTVPCPKTFSPEQDRRQEVCIDPAQAAAHQTVGLDERQDFLVLDDRSSREISQELEDLSSILQQTTGELSRHEGMTEHLLIKKQLAEVLVGSSKVVDPYRRVDEDHAGFERARVRRRGMRRALLSDPPNAASRLALSRATSASRPALTTAVFSRRPLSWAARSSNASSMFKVVRICISMAV